ncbi:MAG: hypothetical protein KGI37_10710 [Alphaproteobacteria bacterium]|nr:hypothetical protein [Alphaproteobacteria bacterium]
MNISSVGSSPAVQSLSTSKPAQTATAPDGDPLAVENAETRAKQQAEKANGGFAPNATTATAGGVNKLA